ncbi:MAG: terpene cyclase/mutase family protein, partial [Candidatus Poribacteria bacterium]|nr:terpene cyclase/mutase family protein [Candidatus Poribacteria bacterium]
SSVIRRGVTYLIKHQKADGSWNGNTAHTIFALMALARAETDADARFNSLKWISEAQNEDGSWGREIHQSGNLLYTGAVLSGLRQLGFNRSLSTVPKAADWLANRINVDGGWSMVRGAAKSDLLVTSWVLQGLSLVYDIDEQIAWLKQMQNADGGFGRQKGDLSDPEVTAYAILALVAGEDPLNTDKVAIRYLRGVQGEDGSFASATPIELKEPTANLQTTSFVLWAMYARKLSEEK